MNADPYFEREGKDWVDCSGKYMLPECHKHDNAWVCAMLHNKETKQDGAIFEAGGVHLGQAQRLAITNKYSKVYLEKLENEKSINAENIARREANKRLYTAIQNFKNNLK
ncbi:MAG: hypothetical protein U5M23_01415 [Marinagarivorans sp.]|nr:hypothetical protein [Marinagarivorans sp.]